MTILEHIKTHGPRNTARALINIRVNKLTGLSLDDLPDSAEVCALLDNLEQQLKTDSADKEKIKEILSEINADFLESLIYE